MVVPSQLGTLESVHSGGASSESCTQRVNIVQQAVPAQSHVPGSLNKETQLGSALQSASFAWFGHTSGQSNGHDPDGVPPLG